jgi:hypothetical protein
LQSPTSPVDKVYQEVTEMSVSPAELTNAANPSVGTQSTESTEVLISTQQVLLSTAAARGLHRDQTGGRFGGILRRFFGTSMDDARPPRHDVPRRYGFLENAELSREMDRL